MAKKIHDYWMTIFKKGDGEELRDDYSLILEKMSIKNSASEPTEVQKEVVSHCLELINKGDSLDNAVVLALKKAAEKSSGGMVKAGNSQIASSLKESVKFDTGIDDFLSSKADELTKLYEPKEALAHILEGMIERGEDLNGGMSHEEMKEYYRMMGKQKIDSRVSERTRQSIPLSEAEAIFNDVVARRKQQ